MYLRYSVFASVLDLRILVVAEQPVSPLSSQLHCPRPPIGATDVFANRFANKLANMPQHRATCQLWVQVGWKYGIAANGTTRNLQRDTHKTVGPFGSRGSESHPLRRLLETAQGGVPALPWLTARCLQAQPVLQHGNALAARFSKPEDGKQDNETD